MQFSVIIPVYNREHLIVKTLDSVFDQTIEDYEVIVVDDGSTDRTAEVVDAYRAPLRLIQQENAGPGVARNTGIDAARGEYVVFLDSDDRWFPWTLETVQRAIVSYDEPPFVSGRSVDLEKKPVPGKIDSFKAVSYEDYYETGVGNVQIYVGACAIRTETLKKVNGFSERAINGEDSDLWMRLGVAEGFVRILSPPIHAYRRHAESAVSNLWRSYLGGIHMIKQEKSGHYPGGANRRRDRLRIITRHLRPKALRLLRAGEFGKAFLLYRHTLKWNWALRRFKFLLGFPAVGAVQYIQQRVIPGSGTT